MQTHKRTYLDWRVSSSLSNVAQVYFVAMLHYPRMARLKCLSPLQTQCLSQPGTFDKATDGCFFHRHGFVKAWAIKGRERWGKGRGGRGDRAAERNLLENNVCRVCICDVFNKQRRRKQTRLNGVLTGSPVSGKDLSPRSRRLI